MRCAGCGSPEANPSGLLGPAVAYSIMERCIPFRPGCRTVPRIFT